VLPDTQGVQRSPEMGSEIWCKMNTVLADPAKMIAKGAPHVIHNDKELEVYTNALFQLTALEDPSSAEVEAIELLTLLVERYEQTIQFPTRMQYPSCGFSSNSKALRNVI